MPLNCPSFVSLLTVTRVRYGWSHAPVILATWKSDVKGSLEPRGQHRRSHLKTKSKTNQNCDPQPAFQSSCLGKLPGLTCLLHFFLHCFILQTQSSFNEWNHDVVRARYQSEDANKTSCSARNILPVSTCNTFAVFGWATYTAWMNDGWRELTGRTVTVSRNGSWNGIFSGCLYVSQLLTFSEFKKMKSKVLSWGVSLKALFFFNDRITGYQCGRILGYSSLLSLSGSHSSGILSWVHHDGDGKDPPVRSPVRKGTQEVPSWMFSHRHCPSCLRVPGVVWSSYAPPNPNPSRSCVLLPWEPVVQSAFIGPVVSILAVGCSDLSEDTCLPSCLNLSVSKVPFSRR